MPVITIDRLTKRYGRRVGIEDVTLAVPEGTLFGFLGPNGSGKTTTIRILLGLLKSNGGSASIFGKDCWRDSHVIKREVGYLPGDLRLYSWLTCAAALKLFGAIRGRDLNTFGGELAEDFALERDVPVRKMSRGMRQKLGLILALAHKPRLLVLDEPTSALDPLMQEMLCTRLRALAAEGHTVFFSSHTLSEVDQLCDRVAIVREGRLVADETLEQMRARARRLVTIRWRDGTAVGHPAPAFLDVFERKGRDWKARLTGAVPELLRWSAALPIEDLSVGQPDLATLFQRYYTDPERPL